VTPSSSLTRSPSSSSSFTYLQPTRSCHFRSRFFSTSLTQNNPSHMITNGHHHLRLRVPLAQIHINTKFLHCHFHTQPQEQRTGTPFHCQTLKSHFPQSATSNHSAYMNKWVETLTSDSEL